MKNVYRLLYLFLSAQLIGCIMYSVVTAEVPNEITYSGRLREYGQPVSGTRTIIFRICNHPSAGSELWTSGPQSIIVSSGVFSYILRPSLDWCGATFYIETQIESKVLKPREKITAQALSLHSRTAEDIEKSAGQNIHFAIGGSTIATINSDGNIKNFVPTGTILSYGGTTSPTGYLLCNGQTVSRTTYSDLYAVIGTSFGQGDGSTTFNVPDLRGRFLRGKDNGAGRDPDASTRTAMATGGNTGDNVGSVQVDDIKNHKHNISIYVNNSGSSSDTRVKSSTGGENGVASNSSDGGSSGNETRPINAYITYMIKY